MPSIEEARKAAILYNAINYVELKFDFTCPKCGNNCYYDHSVDHWELVCPGCDTYYAIDLSMKEG